jgi:pyrroline-5-carboxylate reductase
LTSTPGNLRTTVGVIGTGNMGSALVKGWLRLPGSGIDLLVWDRIEAAARRLLGPDGVAAAGSLGDLVARADVVLVVVKPKDAGGVLGEIAGLLREDQTLISAMAGVTLGRIRGIVGSAPALFRIMPNLGVELRVGAVALAAEPGVPETRALAAMRLFEPLGLVQAVAEDMLDAVTAVSGSGPAFLALVMESLEDGAVAAGLSRSLARTLVRQTALGTAQLLSLSSDSPAELRARLALTGDLDQQGIDALEDRGVRSAFQEAVEAAVRRSRQLR